jgi:DNA primase
MDGDDAGRQSAEANASILAKHVYVRLVELPEGAKPDSVPDHYLDKFR